MGDGKDANTVTVSERPAPEPISVDRSPSLTGISRELPLPSPETVLLRAEMLQSRRTAVAGLIFNTLGLLVVPFVGGDYWAQTLCMVGLALAELNNLWLLFISTSERRYSQGRLMAYFAVAPVLNTGIIYYLGVFGPVLVMLVLNVYTACLGYGRAVARVTLVGGIAPVAVLGLLMSTGIIGDPGIITAARGIPLWARSIHVGAFAAFLVLVYLQARAAREMMLASLRERDEAVRRASHREALFLEARQDLERALQAGGLGRFTEQTLGSYRLGAVIGRGGMGEVYEAVHVQTQAPAAVKLLLPEVLGRPELVRRFLREVSIAASFDSPHVVRVFEVGGETAPLPYLAMERLRGEDLAQVLRKETRLQPAAAVELVRQVGRGLAAAAAAGVIHRDLKPQNVFRHQPEKEGEPPVWKILDFGIATLEQQTSGLTLGDAVIGTPQYMAPEQVRHEPVSARTDLYALGAIAYRAITGNPPFKQGDFTEVLTAVLSRLPVRPSAIARVPREIDLVLAIALAKAPVDRFATGDELADALAAAFDRRLSPELARRAAMLLVKLPWREV